MNGHKSKLRLNLHKNKFLQRHVNKYGLTDLQFSILELCPQNQLLERELYWFNILDTDFNILSNPNSSLGFKHDPASIQKMKDWKQSEEGRKWKEKYSGENSPQKRVDVRIRVSINSGSHKTEVREKIRQKLF
jgi:group I intron endonuclease